MDHPQTHHKDCSSITKHCGNLMWSGVSSTSLKNALKHERVVVDSEQ